MSGRPSLGLGVTARFHPSLPEHSRRLMETLGVTIIFDEKAPRVPPDSFHDPIDRAKAARQKARRQARQLELSARAADERVAHRPEKRKGSSVV